MEKPETDIFLDTLGGICCARITENGKSVGLIVRSRAEDGSVGNLYLGRVVNIVRALNAAFVDIGLEKNAFLPLDEMQAGEKITQGKEILVQITKEPGGDKGHRITMKITLPGTFAVLLPFSNEIGISRHIENEERRAYLTELTRKSLQKNCGAILRTAAGEAEDAEIRNDLSALWEQWKVLSERAKKESAPRLLFSCDDLESVLRRDYPQAAFYTGESLTDINRQEIIGAMREVSERKCWLKSGGFLVIDPCEALTVIDVNSGKYTGGKGQQELIVKINQEAAREAARQIRLRDIGGIILIDFIDMNEEEERALVEHTLEEAFNGDRAKHHLHGYTGAGLFELTRRPLYAAEKVTLRQECPLCRGNGSIQSTDSVVYQALTEIIRTRRSGNEGILKLRAHNTVIQKVCGVLSDEKLRYINEPRNGYLLESDIEEQGK